MTTSIPAVLLTFLFPTALALGQAPQLQLQTGHIDKINSVSFSPDGKLLASGGDDQKVKLWEVSTGNELRSFSTRDEINSVAFSPDGNLLAAGGELQAATVWDLASGKERFHFSELSFAIAFNPNGQTIAIADAHE